MRTSQYFDGANEMTMVELAECVSKADKIIMFWDQHESRCVHRWFL